MSSPYQPLPVPEPPDTAQLENHLETFSNLFRHGMEYLTKRLQSSTDNLLGDNHNASHKHVEMFKTALSVTPDTLSEAFNSLLATRTLLATMDQTDTFNVLMRNKEYEQAYDVLFLSITHTAHSLACLAKEVSLCDIFLAPIFTMKDSPFKLAVEREDGADLEELNDELEKAGVNPFLLTLLSNPCLKEMCDGLSEVGWDVGTYVTNLQPLRMLDKMKSHLPPQQRIGVLAIAAQMASSVSKILNLLELTEEKYKSTVEWSNETERTTGTKFGLSKVKRLLTEGDDVGDDEDPGQSEKVGVLY